ncbi:unnamed protein product [Chondrus crispus]|uniref:Uncharacterized protein n=1 Tax=Chondrus crispus TaxID=2769 RepID=R7QRG8_CHOCR|nr:unnamed protein product [Chondrus crispus]CDF39955.1 unnamed protein product [Chondrus crispus]|eukprot:XP_005710249.1 unnamed protein product [Chondrus crispus]
MGISMPICQAMKAAGYGFPTPIQRKVIPNVLAGDDVVAMARTGSGKTAAFLVPLIHRLDASPLPMSTASRRNGPRALVVAPTRELVLQTLKFCRLYSKCMQPPLRTAVVVGGTPLEAQFEALAVCPDIIFATPGRLLQLLAEMGARGGLTLSTAESVVFDEADRLFEGTLAVETAALIANLRNRQTETIEDRQTILISATMPHALAEFSRTGLRKSLSVVRLDADKGISPTLAVAFLSTRGDVSKDAALQVLVRRILDEGRTLVVFAATHRRVEYLTELLRVCITPSVGCIHGNMDQMARLDAVGKFRKKFSKVLVVTDVAARGIDLPELGAVINYDIPATPKLFIHRVGRVGRAGRFGLAFNLVASDEVSYMLDTFLFVGRGVTFAERRGADNREASNPFSCHTFATETSFIVGALPKCAIDEEVEITRHAIQGVELSKAYKSARNAQGLYTKTRGVASGESVRRGKEIFTHPNGGRRNVHVHPWFTDLETDIEREASEQAARLSLYRPRETMVTAPDALLKRIYPRMESDATEGDSSPQGAGKTESAEVLSTGILESLQLIQSKEESARSMKISARQAALEEERNRFFLSARQDVSQKQSEKALKVRSGGVMGDGLNAFRELRDAAMDMNADANSDLLRSKHTGSSTAKYWDRVSKKYVRGGPTSTTSKRNLHVATREARANAKGGDSYGTADGALFSKWLYKNRKAVEQLAEKVADGVGENVAHLSLDSGLGNNDFRKGAFGRRARVAAAAKTKRLETSDNAQGLCRRNELKSTDEIRKSRKLKAKAEARRLARSSKKPKGYKGASGHSASSHRGPSRSKLIIRRQ